MASIRDTSFAPTLEPPFPPGTSPFRQKGNGYVGDVPWLDSCVRGGFAAAVAALPDPRLQAFFAQRFRPSEWYDAYPGACLELVASRLRGIPFERHRRETGVYHAKLASRGVYGTLLRMISSESLAVWAPRIAMLYFEFGRTESRVVGPREVVATRRAIPAELAQWQAYVLTGFAESTLAVGGAREARAEIVDVNPDGSQSGRALVRLDLRMTWA